jgi:large subunit ribosomal protein L30
VSDKAHRTIRIKWVRSGIGFSYHQKRIVRSLGLKKLNQEVERPDTPQIRGLVAKVPHLVKIVEAGPVSTRTSVPEYTIYPRNAMASKEAETAPETPAVEIEKTEAPAMQDVAAAQPASANDKRPVEAQGAPEAATQTSGDLAASENGKPADASGKLSAEASNEAFPKEGEPKD